MISGLKKLSDEARKEALRRLCLDDLYFLLVYVLHRWDVLSLENPKRQQWVFERCREVQANPNNYLDLWAREHYKSTIITFALTIQDILRNPEETFGLFSHTRPIAKGFLRQIMREFEDNVMLKWIFSDVLWAEPRKQAPKWSEDDGIIVKRKGNPKECTVEAWGLVDGQPTSKHYSKRVYDDTVTRESVTTPDQIQKTTDAWELSDNLGTEGGTQRYIGTRYNLSDTYKTMIERGINVRLYAATHNRKMDGKPVLFTDAYWAHKLKTQSRKTLAAQMMQNPMADADAVFDALWLRPYEVRPRIMNVAIMCDPSRGKHANSDSTAMPVVGMSTTGAKYLLDGYCHRMSLSQRWANLRDLHKKWSAVPGIQHVAVGYERYGAQSDDEYFDDRMIREKYPISIKELNWVREGGQSKEHRVERLEPDFRNSRFYLPLAVWKDSKPMTWKVDDDPDSATYQSVVYREFEGATKLQREALDSGSADLICKAIKRLDQEKQAYDLTVRLIEQYTTFPFGGDDDLIDAVSRWYDMEMHPPVLYSPEDTNPTIYHDS